MLFHDHPADAAQFESMLMVCHRSVSCSHNYVHSDLRFKAKKVKCVDKMASYVALDESSVHSVLERLMLDNISLNLEAHLALSSGTRSGLYCLQGRGEFHGQDNESLSIMHH
jgi:hypothetical protein